LNPYGSYTSKWPAHLMRLAVLRHQGSGWGWCREDVGLGK
jgi:hypothetical protein